MIDMIGAALILSAVAAAVLVLYGSEPTDKDIGLW